MPLLKILSFCILPSGIHACLAAWHFGQNKTAVPAVCQFLEQCVRTAGVWLICQVLLQEGRTPTAELAAAGMLIGEVFSLLFTLAASGLSLFSKDRTRRTPYRLRQIPAHFLPLFSLALPLTLNRILVNVLHSMEAALIPGRLRLCGLSASGALSVYGVLTGMAMPLLSFPTALTHAVSTLLLPDVAREQAAGRIDRIRRTTEQAVHCCLLLGVFSTGLFLVYGQELGSGLFHEKQAGYFLQALSLLCPFLYLESTLSSVLGGLGRTGLVFCQNMAGVLIRIAFVWFAIPVWGVFGCIAGILAGEIAVTVLSFAFLRRQFSLRLHPLSDLVQPALVWLTAELFARAGTVLLRDLGLSDARLLAVRLLLLTACYGGILLLFHGTELFRAKKNAETVSGAAPVFPFPHR